jgi:hypothetical protein
MTWRAIETAPRDSSRVLIAFKSQLLTDHVRVHEAWWRMPYEAAPLDQCAWQTMDGMVLSADVHGGLGATHWMPLPTPPQPQAGEV